LMCGCASWLRDYIANNPPRFNDWFRYSWEMHESANAKLNKSPFTFEEAYKRWRPHQAYGQQPSIHEYFAVTSLAPHRMARQTIVLDSWKRFGLSVYSVNSPTEIEQLRPICPQVDRWISSDPPDGCKTQRINALLEVAVRKSSPILLINSDIEIYGDQERLFKLIANRVGCVGIRYNYEMHPGVGTQEAWGLDAFLVYPEQVKQFPVVDYSIGKPMWDYWLPWQIMELGGKLDWIGEPFFFHESHPITWTGNECVRAREDFAVRFSAFDWGDWRRSLPFPPK
jgi:hypothetical protein